MATAHEQFNPNIKLTNEENNLVEKIKTFTAQHLHDQQHAIFVVTGDAGTGKSVVLTNLFYQFEKASREQNNPFSGTNNMFLVNHPELLKTYQQIAMQEPNMKKKDFQRPTSFINAMHKANAHNDITIIDEAHLLISQPDHYNKFMQENQLAEILKISKVTIIVFDPQQVVRTKSYWDQALLDQITAPYQKKTYHLTNQYRMHASKELIQWLDNFSAGKVTPLPQNYGKNYDFRIYNDCKQMYEDLLKRDNEAKLSRILATLSYHHKIDGVNYVEEGNLKLPWDTYNFERLPYPEIPKTLHEVGSMFTCQGFDLNYAAVIIGPSIGFNQQTQNLVPEIDKYTYRASMTKRHDITDPKVFDKVKKQLIMDDLNVLLKRGVKGLYLYIHNDELRNELYQEFEQQWKGQVPNGK